MYTDCHLNVHVSAQLQICSRVKVSTLIRAANEVSFLSTAKKSRRQPGNNNGKIVNKIILGVVPVLKVTIKQYDEAELTAASVAEVAFMW